MIWFQSQAQRYSPEHPRYRYDKVQMYSRLARDFGELAAALEQIESPAPPLAVTHAPYRTPSVSSAAPAPKPSQNERARDLSDLPPELLKELSDSATKGETDVLVKIINERGGRATLDEILIDLFRKHGEVGKRTITGNKLYRLSKRGLVWALPGKKGIYTTKPDSLVEQSFKATSDVLVTLFEKPVSINEA